MECRFQVCYRSGQNGTSSFKHKSGPLLSNTNRTQKKHIATPRRRSTNRDLLPCRLHAADRSHQPVGISFPIDSRVSATETVPISVTKPSRTINGSSINGTRIETVSQED
ncbi:hypothetical protein LXL04_013102 [Taraxacum kok-saghyz]